MTDRITAIRERVSKATEGPWTCERDDSEDGTIYYAIHGAGYHFITNVDESQANGEFIAASREDIPFLLSELTARDSEIEGLREALILARHAIVGMSAISDGKFTGASLFKDSVAGHWYTREDVLDAIEKALRSSKPGGT